MRDKNTILLEEAYSKILESYGRDNFGEYDDFESSNNSYENLETAHFDFNGHTYCAIGDADFDVDTISYGELDSRPGTNHKSIGHVKISNIRIYNVQNDEADTRDIINPIKNPHPKLVSFAEEQLKSITEEKFENDEV